MKRRDLYFALVLALLMMASLPGSARGRQDIPSTDLPCLLSPTARGVIVLFSGSADELTANFTHTDGSPPTWKITSDGAMLAQNGDILTKQRFDDFLLHVEFNIPYMPAATGQARGNSGVILQGRYEIQILDSYGVDPAGTGDCGAVYGMVAPLFNACKAPKEWQSYDILFRAPRVSADGVTILHSASVTVFQNGILVQNNSPLPHHTAGFEIGDPNKPGSILLQYHRCPVCFRKIWILPLSPAATDEGDSSVASDLPSQNQRLYNWQDVPQNLHVPVDRAVFDKGGYQIYATTGETILVPFTDQNLYVLKFGRSDTGQTYFVKAGSTPILYLTQDAYLENAAVPNTRWYPLSEDFVYASPVYVGPAPGWSDYLAMGWYPGMWVDGGAWFSYPGAPLAWMPDYSVRIAGTTYGSYAAYRSYTLSHAGYVLTGNVFNNYTSRRPAIPWTPGRGTPGAVLRPISPGVPMTPPDRRFIQSSGTAGVYNGTSVQGPNRSYNQPSRPYLRRPGSYPRWPITNNRKHR